MTAQVRTTALAAGTWTVSDSRTRVTFAVRNLGRPAHGSVACSWGLLEVDEAGLPARVSAELDLESLDTGIARRDADLRKPRFLDIESREATKEAVACGFGIAPVLRSEAGEDRRCVLVPIEPPAPFFDEYVACSRELVRTPLIKAFLEAVHAWLHDCVSRKVEAADDD